MSEVHKPHLQSGYLKAVRFENRLDNDGNPDWMMVYVPGPKARAEYNLFAKKERALEADVTAADASGAGKSLMPVAVESATFPDLAKAVNASTRESPEVREMMARGISEKKARELFSKLQTGQQVIDQLEWGDEVIRRSRPGTFRNPPGLLISFVEGNLTPPFESSRLRTLREKAEREKLEHRSKLLQLELRPTRAKSSWDAYSHKPGGTKKVMPSASGFHYLYRSPRNRRRVRPAHLSRSLEPGLESRAKKVIMATVPNRFGTWPTSTFPARCRSSICITLNTLDYLVVVITNQRGVAHGLISPEDLEEIDCNMVDALVSKGARIDDIFLLPAS
jgi:hypothetical protein